MVKIHEPSIVFLMETKVLHYKVDYLKGRLGFQGLFIVDEIGLSGGLALF